ncbi:MAG TPA: class I SAM-dependent methyltransferase [Thermoanaerobaculia bacterium]|nr:class I SAM-dependent methyltransferase [Thermoanaerobaculia bacterium]
MSTRTLQLDDRIHDYLLRFGVREPELLARLREETAGLGELSRMQISPEQGQLMALLVRAIGARRILEIGTFTGYSALRMALALPEDGVVVACDVSEEWTTIARRYWREAGVAAKIDLRLAPALETLEALSAEASPSFDLAFIDADKGNYRAYYERCLELVRSGGLIAIDNVFWHGDVADDEKRDEDVTAIRELNAVLRDDDRIEISLVPIGDGLTLALKL